jgi:RNA polymerase sigma-32 factor
MAFTDSPEIDRANRRFIREAMRVPLLSPEEELDLTRRLHGNDQKAIDALVAAHGRLIISAAFQYRRYGLPLGDLIQEGHVGLMRAAARFDPERGVRFSTYATWWIRSSIQEFILRNWSIVPTGTSAMRKSLFFNLRRLQAQITSDGTLGPDATALIAKRLHASVDAVESMAIRLGARDQSTNAPAGEGDGEWGDILPDTAPTPEDQVAAARDQEARNLCLAAALAELSPREQTIIRRRHLLDDGATLRDLGYEFGISKERVRQIENRALGKLRRAMARFYDDDIGYNG